MTVQLQAGLLGLLIGGYLLLTYAHNQVRFEWSKRAKPGERRKLGERRKMSRGIIDLRGILLLTLVWTCGVYFFPDASPWQTLAPAYVLVRMAAGAFLTHSFLPVLHPVVRETLHFLIFLGLVWATWN
jgi:hypothetical protein